MKKAIFIILLAALLSGCGNAADTNTETAAPAQTTAVSHNTNISETAPEIKAVNVKISEEKKTTTTTTAETTSTSKATTTTTKAETTTSGTTSKSTTRTAVSETTTTRQPIQQTETYIVYYDESSPETQQTQPEVRVTETKPITTTVQTTPPITTTTSPPTTTTTAPPSGIEWSESMKVWRKLCEGKKLSGSEQDIIRNEILDYAVSSFNGKKDIHVSFGIDRYDISYEKPLNITINRGMTGMANAHYDAYADPDSKWLIDYASSEQEIYDIVADTRQSCLHLIDHGLFNRWEIMSMNGALKYASDIEFNVGFDEDMTIWFLTQD